MTIVKRACVIGWPIKHSRSPLIHGYWLKRYRLEGQYDRIAVHPDDLASFINGMRENGILGCNVTIPHKEAVARMVAISDPLQRRIGSINTVYFGEGGRLEGESTDGIGFWRALEINTRVRVDELRTAIVLGAGGASKSVVAALVEQTNAAITVVGRDAEKVTHLCSLFDTARVSGLTWSHVETQLSSCDLLINTTPLGMKGYAELEIDLRPLGGHAVVYDLVYVPLETAFLRQARERGLKTVGGLDMLLYQAAPGFERWFGVRPEVTDELRDILVRDIESGA